MNTEIENIIVNHDYVELTSAQKASVSEWAASEEEYTVMKDIIASAPMLNADVAPSPKLKASLMDTFAATQASGAPMTNVASVVPQKRNNKVIYLWLRAGVAVAAVLLTIFMIYPLFNTNESANLVAENKEVKKVQTAALGAKENEPLQKKNVETTSETGQSLTEEYIAEFIPPVEPRRDIVPTTGPNDGLASLRESNETSSFFFMTDEPTSAYTYTDFSPPLSPTMTTFNGGVDATNINYTTPNGSKLTDHSDRLAVADLPESSRQVIHEQPELLDLLHTSF